MESLTLADFEAQADAFDAAVLLTPDIDHFCSSSDWIVPAHENVMPERSLWLRRYEHGFAALARGEHEAGWSYLQPLEAAWCLPCPLVGKNVHGLVQEFVDDCRAHESHWDLLMLGGVQPESLLFSTLAEGFGRHYQILLGTLTQRCAVELEGGIDGFLRRRSHNFRLSLKKACRRARESQIIFERVNLGDANKRDGLATRLYERIQCIEEQSWKGVSAAGINVGEMRGFYAQMMQRLVHHGRLRLIFARHNGRDIGFNFGAVLGRTYRGLQFSFVQGYEQYSIGNLLQFAQLGDAATEGITVYDLGTDMEYKRRWADSIFETVMVYVAQPQLTFL